MTDRIIVIIDDHKFDVTNYIDDHLGARDILTKNNGNNVTQLFNECPGHFDGYVLNLLDKFHISDK